MIVQLIKVCCWLSQTVTNLISGLLFRSLSSKTFIYKYLQMANICANSGIKDALHLFKFYTVKTLQFFFISKGKYSNLKTISKMLKTVYQSWPMVATRSLSICWISWTLMVWKSSECCRFSMEMVIHLQHRKNCFTDCQTINL